jgi:glycine hydroxymethyltransferase
MFNVAAYHVGDDGLVDMDEVARLAHEHRPKMIIAGWSAYPRQLDFAAFRRIADETGALLMVDMAHFAGLVAAGLHPSPVPHADIVTTTTHKTLCGPRGGLILCREEFTKKINSAVFPGTQVQGARILAERLLREDSAKAGVKVLTGGTDVHLVLVDLVESELTGRDAEDRLHDIGITVNRNAVPNDPRPPMVTSGLRIGTPALATRGFQEADFADVADVIALALQPSFDSAALSARVHDLAERHPLYPSL